MKIPLINHYLASHKMMNQGLTYKIYNLRYLNAQIYLKVIFTLELLFLYFYLVPIPVHIVSVQK